MYVYFLRPEIAEIFLDENVLIKTYYVEHNAKLTNTITSKN